MMVNAYQMKRRYYDKQSMFFHLQARPEHGRAHPQHLPSGPEVHPRGSASARPLPARPRGPRRRQLLDLHLPRAVQLRHGHLCGHQLGHRCAEGPKHGGANLKVMHQLDYILENVEDPSNDDEVREFLRRILRKERGDAAA